MFPAIWSAADAAIARLTPGEIDIETEASHAAADVIFRALFSLPIEHQVATDVFRAFRAHQDTQPIVNLAALLPLPRWMPRWYSRRTRATAAEIRSLIETLVMRRLAEINAGTAPDDLATKIMTTPDPETGERFSAPEMVDQVAIFFWPGMKPALQRLAGPCGCWRPIRTGRNALQQKVAPCPLISARSRRSRPVARSFARRCAFIPRCRCWCARQQSPSDFGTVPCRPAHS